ncbi:foldase protein PrsA [Brevibacillus ginsengisoli]|uniref:peptidylprolyl isomerase n=1 Tax=Brevibacillus ginsengisoli TaxID=363854 RepID=UPI003CEC662C
MTKGNKRSTAKKILMVLSTTTLALSLLAGCGKPNDQKAQPAQPNQTQPATGAGNAANDPLAQFPALKIPFTVGAEDAVVEYQGGKVTGKQFESFLKTITFFNPQQREMIEAADKTALENYAHEYTGTVILASRADDKDKAASKALSEQTYEKIKSQYQQMIGKDEATYTKLLQNMGLTKEEIIEQMTLINSSIEVLKKSVDEATLNKMYESNKDAYTKASVRHILISTEKRKPEEALKLANDLEARLKKGEDFAKLAKENSDDPGSKDQGGLYENADVDQWVPEFKKAALTQPIGQIGAPVKTNFGYHIIRVESRSKNEDKLKQQGLQMAYDKFLKQDLTKLVTKWNIPEPKPAKK